MSFYTGNYQRNKICHITKGQHDIETMRGAPFSDTVFHTDITYMDYKLFDLSQYSTFSGTFNDTYLQEYVKSVKLYKIEGELYTHIFTNDMAWSLYDNVTHKIYHNPGFFGIRASSSYPQAYSNLPATDSALWAHTGNDVHDFSVPGDDFCVKNVPKQGAVTGYPWLVTEAGRNLTMIVWGATNSGTITPFTSQNRAGDILINRTTFLVGSYDILNMKYLSPSAINNADLDMDNEGTNNDFQLVNSVPRSGGIEIVTNSDETYITNGGSKILTTNMGSSLVDIVGNYTKTLTAGINLSVSNGQSKDHWGLACDGTFSNNDPFFITIRFLTDNDGGFFRECPGVIVTPIVSKASSAFVVKYNDGYICNLMDGSYRYLDFQFELHGRNNQLWIYSKSSNNDPRTTTYVCSAFRGRVVVNTLQ